MLTPASVREIWNILVERARTASMAVIPVGCGTFVFSEEALAELPDGPNRSAFSPRGRSCCARPSRDDAELPILTAAWGCVTATDRGPG